MKVDILLLPPPSLPRNLVQPPASSVDPRSHDDVVACPSKSSSSITDSGSQDDLDGLGGVK